MLGAKLGSLVQRSYGVTAALTIGLTAILDGLAIGLTADAAGDLGSIVLMVTVASVGFGMVMSVGLDLMSAALPLSNYGTAWAATETMVQIGGLVGLALVGSLVDRGYHDRLRLPSALITAEGATVTRDSLGKGVAAAASAGTSLADAVQNAFLAGYRHGLLALIVVVATVMVAILAAAARSKSRRGAAPLRR